MHSEAEPVRPAPQETAGNTGQVPKLLIVEDVPHWVQLYRAILTRFGCSIESAGSYNEAAELLRCTEFTLGIIDLQLADHGPSGNRDGVRVLERLAAARIPAIIVTGWATPEYGQRIVQTFPNVLEIIDKASGEALEKLVKRAESVLSGKQPACGSKTIPDAEQSHSADLLATPPAVPPRKILTWLHLSDLHLRAVNHPIGPHDQDIVLGGLLEDIREQVKREKLTLDFAVITGDLAYSGQQVEYGRVQRFLQDLAGTCHLPLERIYMVPGNHDVDRKRVTGLARRIGPTLLDRAAVNEVLQEHCDRQLLMARLTDYGDFVNKFSGGNLPFSAGRFFWVKEIELQGTRVGLLGLNSAWLSASDQDEAQRLVLGECQVREALERSKSCDLRIVLLHHPLELLRDFDREDCEGLLLNACHFILHGHVHRQSIRLNIEPDGSNLTIAAGASFASRNFPNRYNFVQLDLHRCKGRMFLRRYNDTDGGFWGPDGTTYRHVPNGIYEFEWPTRPMAAQLLE